MLLNTISTTSAELFRTTNAKGDGFFAQKTIKRFVFFPQRFGLNLEQLGKRLFNREMASKLDALKKK